ncbi:hypothetical protein N7G274_000435 [Stereocaulon virgatum]|uniref:Uncharacterized protein n=1 Tax=Stereocaulon virgatum TaxID=373712 RepID=A0ABR4AS56_9LECA
MKCCIVSEKFLNSKGIFRGVQVAGFIGSLRLLELHGGYLLPEAYYMRAEGWPGERVSRRRGSFSHCVDLNRDPLPYNAIFLVHFLASNVCTCSVHSRSLRMGHEYLAF